MAGPVEYTDAAGNVLTTPAHIMMAAMMALAVKPVAAQPGVIKRDLDQEFTKGGVKLGSTIWMRLKQYWEVTKGKTWVGQDIKEEVIPIHFDQQYHVGFEWESFVEKRYIQDVMERDVGTAMLGLVNHLDNDAMHYIGDTLPRFQGTLGQLPGEGDSSAYSGYRTYSKGVKILKNMGVPGPYHAIVNPLEDLDLQVDSMGLFNPAGQIGKNYRTGQFSGGTNGQAAAGINYWYEAANSYFNKVGIVGGAAAPLVRGANQSGDTLETDGWVASTSTLRRGNILSFVDTAAVYETNPQPPHRSYGIPWQTAVAYYNENIGTSGQEHVITADSNGRMSIPIWPPMLPSGKGQNMTKAVPDNTAILVYGHGATGTLDLDDITDKEYTMGCVFNADQGVLVMGDLPLYGGVDIRQRVRSRRAGVSVRYIRQYFGKSDDAVSRMDIAYGGAPKGTGRGMGFRVLGQLAV